MTGITIGPLLIPAARLAAAGGILAFLLLARLPREDVRPRLSDWAFRAVVLGLVAARLGYVALHYRAYLVDPLDILAVWQGGFAPLPGVAAAAAHGFWTYRGHLRARLRGLAALLGGVGVWLLLEAALAAWQGPPPDIPLPERKVATLAGPERAITDWAGRPLVVNLWASWCGPCRREMPLLAEVAANSEAVFAFVNMGEKRDQVRTFLEPMTIPPEQVLLDRRRQLAEHFAMHGLPTTLFYDSSGRLVYRHVGGISRAALQNALAKIGSSP